MLSRPDRLERRLGNHGATEIGAIGQGLTQKRYELGAEVGGKGIGIDRLLIFAGAAAAGHHAGSQQQDDTCTMNIHGL
jgi:hypothetical protein